MESRKDQHVDILGLTLIRLRLSYKEDLSNKAKNFITDKQMYLKQKKYTFI